MVRTVIDETLTEVAGGNGCDLAAPRRILKVVRSSRGDVVVARVSRSKPELGRASGSQPELVRVSGNDPELI